MLLVVVLLVFMLRLITYISQSTILLYNLQNQQTIIDCDHKNLQEGCAIGPQTFLSPVDKSTNDDDVID